MAKKSHKQIKKILKDAEKKVAVGEKYYHYKSLDKYYKVIDLVLLENSEEVGVVYETLYEDIKGVRWVRSLDNFLEKVDKDGEEVQRFSIVSNS